MEELQADSQFMEVESGSELEGETQLCPGERESPQSRASGEASEKQDWSIMGEFDQDWTKAAEADAPAPSTPTKRTLLDLSPQSVEKFPEALHQVPQAAAGEGKGMMTDGKEPDSADEVGELQCQTCLAFDIAKSPQQGWSPAEVDMLLDSDLEARIQSHLTFGASPIEAVQAAAVKGFEGSEVLEDQAVAQDQQDDESVASSLQGALEGPQCASDLSYWDAWHETVMYLQELDAANPRNPCFTPSSRSSSMLDFDDFVANEAIFEVVQGRELSAVEQQISPQWQNEWLRRVAAERIQRAWRAWYKYCQENSEWLMTTWIAATMIQARWRTYHLKMDQACTHMQRIIRAFLVRRTLLKRRKAIVIQRRARGVLVRNRVRHMSSAAVKAQALIRGGLVRRRVAKRRVVINQLALKIQCAVRTHQANRKTQANRRARAAEQAREESAIYIQRVFRGGRGRDEAARRLELYNEQLEQYRAATKLQSMARRDAAIKKVDRIRAQKFDRMNEAATYIRKMWLGARTRSKYFEPMEEFGRHVQKAITMQRYARGFLVRLCVWRQAVRAEKELWAALEIQRIWRGYLGRVRRAAKYEEVWQREMAAVNIQRVVRGHALRKRLWQQDGLTVDAKDVGRSFQFTRKLLRGLLIPLVMNLILPELAWRLGPEPEHFA